MLGKFSPALFIFFLLIMIQVPCWAEFVDIPKTHWAGASVKKVTQDYQIMNGYPGNKFAGTANLSRYEAASIIDKLFINFGKEFDKDRADLANLLEVMELFQGEMKTTKDEVKKRDAKLDELGKISNSLMAENQRLRIQIDSLASDLQALKMKDELKEKAKKSKKKRFFFFGSDEKKEKKIKKPKVEKPKTEKQKNTKSKETKDQEIKNPEISDEETEQMNQQPSTINKELPKAAPDYADEYQH
ncbi:MAG: S-layer homology domain-containing protein [Cyanobacteria bacterium REEB446]|nr:S-layer homology domain-containing protein [Cyanobacteria bacterium REEB446]